MEATEKMSKLGKRPNVPRGEENEIFSNFEQDSTRIIIQHFFEILSQKLVAEYPGNAFSGNVSLVEVFQSAV